eukprot:Lithocolla_globosa_v1_NODE_116_length_6153_cov_4.854870.p2 type:complete len:385 gc:universal NODE_116_length_6153_cov_4.854870:3565-4719(+)
MLYTESGQLYQTLLFSTNSPADISTNIQRYQTDGLVNGCAGHFRKYENDLIWWQPDDPSVGTRYRRSKSHLYTSETPKEWLPFPREKRTFEVDKVRGISITRHQYPFSPSSAKTFHKAQGSSYDNIFIIAQKAKAHYYYVALSRVRSLSGLYLQFFDPDEITVDPFVVKEMEFLRNQGFDLCYQQLVPEAAVYLNIDRLHLKCDNVLSDDAFKDVSAICFAECKLKADDDVNKILSLFDSQYKIFPGPRKCNSSGGLVVLLRKHLPWTVMFDSKYNIEFARLTCMNRHFIFMYRLPSIPISRLKQLCLELRDLHDSVTIIGDLNVELSTLDKFAGFYSNQRLSSRFASNDVASCLDVVLSDNPTRPCHLYPIPYSDHSAVWCIL